MSMRVRGMCGIVGVIGLAMAAGVASARPPVLMKGPRPNEFPDVIVSSVGSRGGSGIDNYGTYLDPSGAISSYAFASDSCNIGNAPAIWINETSSSSGQPWAYSNQHPVIGGAAYRIFNGRLEQIGMSWLKHGFCAADSCGTVGGVTGCTNIPGVVGTPASCSTDYGNSPYPGGTSGCDWLGYARATDTYSAGLNGAQGSLGPRSEVNPWSGVYPHPWGKQGNNPVSCLNKRLLIRKSHLDPAQYPGATYFGEIVYIQPDEWPGQRYNNYSYRKLTVGAAAQMGSCAGTATTTFNLSFASNEQTVPMKPVVEAWKTLDPTVKLSTVDVPNDGRFYVGSKVTNRGDGTWNYEYVVFNMNSDRAARSFMIPKSSSNAVQITLPTNHFRAPEYHSGEGYDMTPWTGTVAGSTVEWSTLPWESSQNANAIRWSTLYNFRFIANRPPTTGSVQIGLFKPAVVTGDGNVVQVAGIDIPSVPCAADFDGANGVTIDDLFGYLNAYFAGCTGTQGAPCNGASADFDGNAQVSIDDLFGFMNAWFTGCP